MLLLTWHGTLVCSTSQGGVLRHEALPAGDAALPLDIDLRASAIQTSLQHPELGILRIEAASVAGAVHLWRDGAYMCADNITGQVAFDRPSASDWESFLPLPAEDVDDLGVILGNRWLVRDSRKVIRRRQVFVEEGFVLRLGPYAVDLAMGLSGLATQRGAADVPVALTLTHAGEQVELVVAEPRSSVLVHTELWPPRARRVAEILTFAAHRQLLGLEPEQEVFERDVSFLEARRGAAGLEDLLETLVPDRPPARISAAAATGAGDAALDDVLRGWAMREVAPWRLHPVSHADAARFFSDLNESRSGIATFVFADGAVSLKAKPGRLQLTGLPHERSQKYLAFFQSVLPLLPPGFTATLCMGMEDALASQFDVPLFCFQKRAGWNNILLPDIDFLMHDFYVGAETQDLLAYEEKQPGAVFVGSTTGGLITPSVARNLSLPRLRAAHFFADSTNVDFRLPVICQCTTPEAEALLRAQPFHQRPVMNWAQQLQRRMLISIDGNGATCSRVAISLHSNSVLLKYASDQVLYYFGGLQPWVHYVPIAEDGDVERVVEMEARDPEMFARIAANGRAFAQTYLSADAARRYTAMLLHAYAESFSDAAPPLRSLTQRRSVPLLPQTDQSYMMGHVQNRGDRTVALGDWLGERGSTLAVEGVAISLADSLPATGFTYQVILASGLLSEVARSGEYRGTRGENVPCYGLLITVDDDFAAQYIVEYEATFIDGTQLGPVPPGTLCAAAAHKQLEAVRITISQRNN